MVQVGLEGHALGKVQGTTQPVGLFVQGHIVTPPCRSNGSLHAGRTATGNHDLLGLRGLWRHELHLVLTADLRVQRAACSAALEAVGLAGSTAQAAADLVFLAGAALQGNVRVRQGLTAQRHHVRLAGGNDLLHHGQVRKAAHAAHRLGHGLLHRRCQMHQVPALAEDRGLHDVLLGRVHVQAGGNVEGIHVGLQDLSDLGSLLHLQAVFVRTQTVVAVHAQLNAEVRPHGLPDAAQHHHGKAGAVFHAAAVLVGALVDVGAEELADQPAMGRMEHGHVEAGLLHPQRRRGVGVRKLLHELLGHFLGHDHHRLLGLEANGHRHLRGTVGALPANEVRVAHNAAVGKLNGNRRAVLVDFLGAASQAGQAVVGVQVHLVRMVLPGGMHDAVPHRDQRHASLCLAGKVRDVVQAKGAVGLDVVLGLRRRHNTVAQDQVAADLQRRVQVRILLLHVSCSP